MDDLIKEYDEHAEKYFEDSYHKILQYQLTQFLSFLPGKKILDVGSASGRDVEYLVDLGYDAYGIDASPKLVALAKENFGDRFKVGKLEELDESGYDGIWCLGVLFLFDKSQVPGILQRFKKALNHGGVLYLGLIEGEGSGYIVEPALDSKRIPIERYTQGEIEELLSEAGFDIINAYSEDDEGTSWLNIFAKA